MKRAAHERHILLKFITKEVFVVIFLALFSPVSTTRLYLCCFTAAVIFFIGFGTSCLEVGSVKFETAIKPFYNSAVKLM